MEILDLSHNSIVLPLESLNNIPSMILKYLKNNLPSLSLLGTMVLVMPNSKNGNLIIQHLFISRIFLKSNLSFWLVPFSNKFNWSAIASKIIRLNYLSLQPTVLVWWSISQSSLKKSFLKDLLNLTLDMELKGFLTGMLSLKLMYTFHTTI